MVAVTARIIREEGFKKATVRTIAEKAHVNIAAVRYYFGSKEELLGKAIDYLMINLDNIVSYLDNEEMTPRERLTRYIQEYFRLALKHPALFRSISYSSSDSAQNTYFVYLTLLHDQCWEKVLYNLAEITHMTKKEDLELKGMQIFSAIEFPIILQCNQSDSFIQNYLNPDCINRYIDILLGIDPEKEETEEKL